MLCASSWAKLRLEMAQLCSTTLKAELAKAEAEHVH